MAVGNDEIDVVDRHAAGGRCIRRRAGTHLVRVKPRFSSDSKYLFVAAETCLLVYGTKTGELIHRLNDDRRGLIVSMFMNGANSLQLITVNCDGIFSFWDYEDGILIRDVCLNVPTKFAYPALGANRFYIALPTKEKDKDTDTFTLNYIKFSSTERGASKGRVLIHNIAPDEKMTSVYKNLAASVIDNRLFVIDSSTSSYKKHLISDEMEFTCVAWHPEGNCLATGDNIGRIILWHNIVPDKKSNSKPIRTNMHWHTNPVADICFSSAGNYLFSGASECVLLKWSTNTPSGKPYFLPRMGLPIGFVTSSGDNSFIVTTHSDNSLNIVDSNLNILHVIQGLAFSSHWSDASLDPLPVGLLCDPRSKALVLNGRSGHLQFYDLTTDKQLYYLDIAQQNYLSKERHKIVYNVEVVKAAFDELGNWLATVEYRDDKVSSPEIRLKFWKYDNRAKNFTLSTSVEMPHFDKVNCTVFQPYGYRNGKSFTPMLATTSDDKRLKLWSFVKDVDGHRQPRYWTCHSVGFYRDLPVGDASFSEDGSVLAVAFNHNVAIWLPTDNILKATLCCPKSQENVRQVRFGRCDCSHLVVCCTQESLTVWDTLSLTVQWSVNVNVSYLTADFASNEMAVFSIDDDLYLFNPSSPDLLEIYKLNENTKIICAAFLPIQDYVENSLDDRKSHLYFLDSDQMLYSLSNESTTSTTPKETITGNLPLTPFGLLIAEQRKSGVEQIEAKFHDLFGSSPKKIIKQILRTPCHVMPPATEISSIFLSSLLKPLQINSSKKKVESSDSEADGANEDTDSDTDNDQDLSDNNLKRSDNKRPVVEDVKPTKLQIEITDEQLLKIENDDYTWLGSTLNN